MALDRSAQTALLYHKRGQFQAFLGIMAGLTLLTKRLYYIPVGQATNGHLTLGGAEMASKIRVALTWLLLTAVFTAAACLLPCQLPLAFDWLHFFENAHNIPAYYPPWTGFVCQLLTWPLLIGLTLSTYAVAVMKRAQSVASAVAAFFAMPLWWVLFLGQLDGLALLGVMDLPWLVPLALMKPQVAAFGIFARRKSVIAAVCFVLLSFAFWGFWPTSIFTYPIKRVDLIRYPQQIGLGLWGLPLAMLVLWVVPGWNTDKLMLAGVFVTPALIPYQLLPLMPAIARLPWWLAWIVALSSWLPVMSNWLGGMGWWLAWFSVVLIGVGLWGQ